MSNNVTLRQVMPSAFVTVNKQRLKQHNNNVYLKNGSSFELELFNPTQEKVLAKIEMNGKLISNGGIVIKPGQRIYLERYLNEAKKFLFETYTVSGNNVDVANAIANNGQIKIHFHNEYVEPYYRYNQYLGGLSSSQTYYSNTLTNSTATFINSGVSGTSGCIGISGVSGTSGCIGISGVSGTLGGNVTKTGGVTLDSLIEEKPVKRFMRQVNVKPEIETGRIEKGETSNQQFVTDNSTYNSYATSTVIWQILPEVKKEFTAKDLLLHCTQCGNKQKKSSDNYCPKCGKKYGN